MKYKEWIMIAEKGTRGDMVWDILNDWRKERDDLLDKTAKLLEQAVLKAEEKP